VRFQKLKTATYKRTPWLYFAAWLFSFASIDFSRCVRNGYLPSNSYFEDYLAFLRIFVFNPLGCLFTLDDSLPPFSLMHWQRHLASLRTTAVDLLCFWTPLVSSPFSTLRNNRIYFINRPL
jgi:hypothetical protein